MQNAHHADRPERVVLRAAHGLLYAHPSAGRIGEQEHAVRRVKSAQPAPVAPGTAADEPRIRATWSEFGCQPVERGRGISTRAKPELLILLGDPGCELRARGV